jgi:superoxide reductase
MNVLNLTRGLFAGVNRPADARNPSDLERRHAPVIKAPTAVKLGEPFSVTVEVGQPLPHPNERRHFIEFIELYADEFFLARVDLTAVNTNPSTTLHISLTGPARELRAYERCNIHGVWGAAVPITVTE